MSKASRIISFAAILLLVVVAFPFSSANVVRGSGCPSNVWVAPWGDDILNPGTQDKPFATIQHGIEVVCDDGTVHVAAGTYYENLEIGKSLTMIGSGAPTTIIDGDDSGRVLHISSIIGQTNTISNFTIQNGHISWGCDGMPVGGGVYVAVAHIVTLNDCTIKNNIADFLGGGIYNAGQITLNRCTISGNSAGRIGGGIANFVDEPELATDGSMSLVNCTISGNTVEYSLRSTAVNENLAAMVLFEPGSSLALGGGVYNGGEASFLNVTIANNRVFENLEADEDGNNFFNIPIAYAGPVIPEPHGGGFANVPLQCPNDSNSLESGASSTTANVLLANPVATFKNTIVANNIPENGYNDGGEVDSLGHNLDSENTCGFNGTGDLRNTNPLLGPLQDNGGPTFTCALLEDSPAIDAGDNNGAPDTDQRGISRPQGTAVDIGAYEFVPTEVPEAEAHPSVSPSTNTLNWTRNLNPPTMSVQFVSINPRQTTANQPVTISTNVVNTGDQGGNFNAVLKINGQVEQTRMVSVGPMASQPIKFTVTKTEPGTYSVDIGGQTGSFIIPGTGSHQAPVSAGLIAFILLSVLILATIMVLLLSRRPA
jgi:hypothetical protein